MAVKTALLALALAVVTGSASAQDDRADKLDEIKERGRVEIAVYDSFPPWSYKADSGGYTGIDVEIAKALGDKLGVSTTINAFPADESMGDDIRNMVWKGHYIGRKPADAMLHVGMAPSFQAENDQATFLGAYYNETMGFVYDAERFGADVDSPLALAGNKIGVQLDTLGDFYLTSAFQGQLRDDVEHFKSIPEAMRAFNKGELAGVMAPLGELRGAVNMLEQENIDIRQVQLTGLYQNDWDVGLAIKAGNPELAQALGEAMTELRDSGRLEEIFNDYGVPYRSPTGPESAQSTAGR
ncbi:MAG: transporter substrate-binding domain-containing protein [Salinisphaeraceae bacterium]